MARRGTMVPISTRLEVKERRAAGDTLRAIAKELGLSVNTVRKYSGASLIQNH